MSKDRVKVILEWLKSELERNFSFKFSRMDTYTVPTMPGKTGLSFGFESDSGLCLGISFWDTGVIQFDALNASTNVDYGDSWYMPENYRKKFYPEESEIVLLQKINELLEILHKENPKIRSNFPDKIL
jgi:hypothetical protein